MATLKMLLEMLPIDYFLQNYLGRFASFTIKNLEV